MQTLLLCLCLATVSLVTSQRPADPTVCDHATKRYGVGFNPHPTDCTQFVQCYYLRGDRLISVYRSCEYGQFWDQTQLRCLPAKLVDCHNDKCKTGAQFYKHSDPNKCGAYWKCDSGKAYAQCCPEGEAFHPELGCVANPKCKDMCPFQDRVPGCDRRPVSGSPTRYMQYTDNGVWKKERCPSGRAYSPVDCECSIEGVVVPGKVCKPDVVIDFNEGKKDVSGNHYRVMSHRVRSYRGAGYFDGRSKLVVEPLRPVQKDEGVLIIKLRYRERKGYNSLQTLVTNGHCGKEASVVVGKLPGLVLLGAEANYSRSFPLPTVEKPWKEVIYIHDSYKLEGRVCGASFNDWCMGKLIDTGCGFQFGFPDKPNKMAGFVGLIDDISIYRCKPLDAVIDINY